MIEFNEDGNYLVRVRAQVMSRDDSSGGWVPLCGGGLSNVSVRKRIRPLQPIVPDHMTKSKHDYFIYGKRISDESIVLSCSIKKDFEYNKVMPTFHHWKTGDKKFGLTFQTAADARAFDKGVRTAVEELLDGLADTPPSSPLKKIPKAVDDDDVFMTLNLPTHERSTTKECHSSSDSTSNKITEHFPVISYIDKEKLIEPHHIGYDKGENYSYVQLTALHEYVYPDDQQKPTMCRDSPSSLKKCPPPPPEMLQTVEHLQSPLKLKANKNQQLRCKYCNELFTNDKNPNGACEYAPDCIKSTINTISCIGCAECVCYHCASDAEGDFTRHPCSHTNEENCTKRWLSLVLLSVLVPCLWLYPPLKFCHWCGIRCGMCGGKHSM